MYQNGSNAISPPISFMVNAMIFSFYPYDAINHAAADFGAMFASVDWSLTFNLTIEFVKRLVNNPDWWAYARDSASVGAHTMLELDWKETGHIIAYHIVVAYHISHDTQSLYVSYVKTIELVQKAIHSVRLATMKRTSNMVAWCRRFSRRSP